LQLFVHTILEVDVGIVGASEEVRAEDALEKAAGNVEAVGEKLSGRVRASSVIRQSAPVGGHRGLQS